MIEKVRFNDGSVYTYVVFSLNCKDFAFMNRLSVCIIDEVWKWTFSMKMFIQWNQSFYLVKYSRFYVFLIAITSQRSFILFNHTIKTIIYKFVYFQDTR